jgi:hypothetical protein
VRDGGALVGLGPTYNTVNDEIEWAPIPDVASRNMIGFHSLLNLRFQRLENTKSVCWLE